MQFGTDRVYMAGHAGSRGARTTLTERRPTLSELSEVFDADLFEIVSSTATTWRRTAARARLRDAKTDAERWYAAALLGQCSWRR